MNPEENTNANPAPAAPAMPTPTPDPITTDAPVAPEVPVAPVSEPIPVPEPNLATEPAAPAEPAAPSYVFGPENPDPAANAAVSATTEPAASPIPAEQTPVEEPAPVVEEPLQPAAPVPGSIGSAISVPENAAEPELPNPSAANPMAESPAFGEAPNAAADTPIVDNPVVAAPINTAPTNTPAADTFVGQIPEKKQGGGAKKALIAIFIILVVAAIAIALYLLGVFDSLLGKTASTNPPVDQPPVVEEEHTYATVTCGHKYTNTAELSSFGDAKKASAEYVLDYVDDELTTLNYTLNISFEDSTMAKAAILNQRDSYVKAFQTLGYETDPFTSEYNNEAEASITRSAEAEDIDEKNAELLGITVSDGKLATDSASLIKNYKAAGFTCETVEE